MSESYEENISAGLMREVWWKKEWHSLTTIPRKVLNKLNRASAVVDISKNKMQEVTTVTVFLSS